MPRFHKYAQLYRERVTMIQASDEQEESMWPRACCESTGMHSELVVTINWCKPPGSSRGRDYLPRDLVHIRGAAVLDGAAGKMAA